MKQDKGKDITKRTYDLIADDYVERDKSIRAVEETFKVKRDLEKFIKLLPAKARVLDIGCGGGRDSRVFWQRGFKVVGIDFSAKMIRQARKFNAEITYRVMDFEQLRFPEREFDGVWANASLHHLPKKRLPPVLNKIYRLLEDQGMFFLKIKKGRGEGMRENFKFSRLIKRYFAFYSPKELKRLLEKSNFQVLSVKVSNKSPHLPGRCGDKGEWVDAFAKRSGV